jgi:hypothetical protein
MPLTDQISNSYATLNLQINKLSFSQESLQMSSNLLMALVEIYAYPKLSRVPKKMRQVFLTKPVIVFPWN